MNEIMFLSPLCPWCGQPPYAVLANGVQAFCGTETCDALIWNPSITAAANLENLHYVTLETVDQAANADHAAELADLAGAVVIPGLRDSASATTAAELAEAAEEAAPLWDCRGAQTPSYGSCSGRAGYTGEMCTRTRTHIPDHWETHPRMTQSEVRRMTRYFSAGRLQRLGLVAAIVAIIGLGGGILGAQLAAAGGPPVTAPSTGPGPYFAGPVHECVAGESTAYFELHSTALGNCARGYVQLAVNELTPRFTLQLGAAAYACTAATTQAETVITCSPPGSPGPSPSPTASTSAPASSSPSPASG